MVSENFEKYIGVFVGIASVCSAAFFTFMLPKIFDYFNNKGYRDYKEMLDLRKSIIESKRKVNPDIDKIIKTYETEFIKNRNKKLKNFYKGSFEKNSWIVLGIIFGAVIVILAFSLFLYQVFIWWLPVSHM